MLAHLYPFMRLALSREAICIIFFVAQPEGYSLLHDFYFDALFCTYRTLPLDFRDLVSRESAVEITSSR